MMTGTGYARSRRDKEEEETREEVPTQKRELKAEKAKTRVETEMLPKGPPPLAMVNTRHAGGIIERAARGFSLGELSASALSFERAKKWRVPLDIRRRTALDGNVTRLTSWLHVVAKPKPEKPAVETAVKAKKQPEPERPREEAKPVEVAKPKARGGLRRREEEKKEKPVKEPKKEKVVKEPKKEKVVKEPKKVAPTKPTKKTKTKTKTKKE